MKVSQTVNLSLYANDFPGFCKLLDIIPKGGTTTKFHLNRIQQIYCLARTARDVVLKPRQIGFTTLELARDVWFFLTRPGARVVVVVQSSGGHNAQRLVSATLRLMFDSLAGEGVKLDFHTDTTAEWVIGNQSLRIIEAGASEASASKKGRGGPINRLHFTETAFYEYAEATIEALMPSVPGPEFGTEIVSECTPNGANGMFYRQFTDASNGIGGYKAHFFPWFMQEEYRVELLEGELVVPINDAEISLVTRYGIGPEQLKWYRQMVVEKGSREKVDQEYPTDPETAFLMRGGLFFDREQSKLLLGRTTNPIAVEMGGCLRIWSRPERGERYIVVSDPSEGTGGDPGAAGVFCRSTGEHVATLHGQFPTWRMGELLSDLGHMYADALLVVERNNHGHAVLQALAQGGEGREPYRDVYTGRDNKPGWLTTEITRASALEALESAHRKGEWSTPDREVMAELFTFVVNAKTGKAEASSGEHDDLVVMMAIAHDVLTSARPANLAKTPPATAYRWADAGRGF